MLDLIKLTANRVLKSGSAAILSHDVIVTLAQLTGLPVSILDNKERVDLGPYLIERFQNLFLGVA